MELGNYMFGHSRGEYPIPRSVGYEDELIRLFAKIQSIDIDDVYVSDPNPFDNDVFNIFPYYWGDCTCGFDKKENEQYSVELDEDEEAREKRLDEFYENNTHSDECLFLRPNFLYKPTGFAIQWYKYPFRDSYANQEVTLEKFKDIIDKCIESLT